jgi:Variant SH3 domain
MATVTQNHEGGLASPIRFGVGEVLRWESRPTEWEGWLWCTDAKGMNGWVPERYVEKIDSDRCRTLRDYDATELTVRVGDELDVHFAESGWAWCETADGRKGWVPESNVTRP